MKTRYSFWKPQDGMGLDTPPYEQEVTLTSAFAILDELDKRPPSASRDQESYGQFAWITFLASPRVLHLYFELEPNRITYEWHQIPDGSLCGLATYDITKEAVRLFFEGQSPRSFLEVHSLELSDYEI
jgi:hypothetical protein